MRRLQETLSQILQQQNQGWPSTSSQDMFLLQQQLQLPPEQRMAPPGASSVSWASLFPGASTSTAPTLPSPSATTAAVSSNTTASPSFDFSNALYHYANSAQNAGTLLPAPGNITLTPEQQLALLIACSNVVQEQQRNQQPR
jgi:hypothetical protein